MNHCCSFTNLIAITWTWINFNLTLLFQTFGTSINDCSLNDLDLKLEIPQGECLAKFFYDLYAILFNELISVSITDWLTVGVIILVAKDEEEEEEDDDEEVEIVGSGKINVSNLNQLQAFLDGKHWQQGDEDNDEDFDMSEVLSGYWRILFCTFLWGAIVFK